MSDDPLKVSSVLCSPLAEHNMAHDLRAEGANVTGLSRPDLSDPGQPEELESKV